MKDKRAERPLPSEARVLGASRLDDFLNLS